VFSSEAINLNYTQGRVLNSIAKAKSLRVIHCAVPTDFDPVLAVAARIIRMASYVASAQKRHSRTYDMQPHHI